MSYLNHFDEFVSTLVSPNLQNPFTIPKLELPPPVKIIDEPGTQASPNKIKSNSLGSDFIEAPFIEFHENDLEGESQNDGNDTYHDAPEHPSDVDHHNVDDSDSTLPVDVYISSHKRSPRFSEDFEIDPILPSHSSNLSDITISSSQIKGGSSRWSGHTVCTWKDLLFTNESRSSFELPGETTPRERLWEGSTLSKTSTRSSFRDLGPDTRTREEIFEKGVPWGFHGRDYIPPLLKSHKLCETMRR